MSVGNYSETETWADIEASRAFYVDALKFDLVGSAFDQTELTTPLSRSERALWHESRTRLTQLFSQLDSLRDLRPDWDSYGASTPAMRTIWEAQAALEQFAPTGLLPTRFVPSAEGGVGMIFTRADRYADLEFLNSGEVLAARYQGNQEPEVWESTDIAETVAHLTRFFGLANG